MQNTEHLFFTAKILFMLNSKMQGSSDEISQIKILQCFIDHIDKVKYFRFIAPKSETLLEHKAIKYDSFKIYFLSILLDAHVTLYFILLYSIVLSNRISIFL